MNRKEMPIFTRTFDFLSWLLPASNNFPRAQRHTQYATAAYQATPVTGWSSSL